MSVCVCVSGILVNKIPAELIAYNTGSNPIEIGDLGSKVKVTVTENVCKNDEKNRQKFKSRHF